MHWERCPGQNVSRSQKRADQQKCVAPPGGLEPPTFRLTAERASQLRHGGLPINLASVSMSCCYLKAPIMAIQSEVL